MAGSPWLELRQVAPSVLPAPATRCRLAWNRRGLQACIVGEVDPRQVCTPMGDQGCLWKQAAVELFLQPDPRRAQYLEVEVAPDGALLVLLICGRGPSRRRWEPWRHGDRGVAARSRIARGSWRVDLRIAWTAFTGIAEPPTAGDRWRLNVTRCGLVDGKRQLCSLARLGAVDFHRFQDFAGVRFAQERS